MEIKAIFGILSSIFVLVGVLPYIKDIHKGDVRPHVLSWFGWAFITIIGAFAMLAEGSQWAVAILFANATSSLIIAVYAIIRKVGVWSTTIYDYALFGLGILGIVLWQTLHLPILALICVIIADFCFGLPTIFKTWKDPSSETYFVWMTAALSGLLSLFALKDFTFSESAYPLYLFIFDTVVLLLVLKIIKRKPL